MQTSISAQWCDTALIGLEIALCCSLILLEMQVEWSLLEAELQRRATIDVWLRLFPFDRCQPSSDTSGTATGGMGCAYHQDCWVQADWREEFYPAKTDFYDIYV